MHNIYRSFISYWDKAHTEKATCIVSQIPTPFCTKTEKKATKQKEQLPLLKNPVVGMIPPLIHSIALYLSFVNC